MEDIKKITSAGYRPVALLHLFDANLIIQPVEVGDVDAGWTDGDKNSVIQKMERQDLSRDCVVRLFAKEDHNSLKLVAEFKRGGPLSFSSYRGRYEIFWDFEQQEGGGDE